MKKFKELATGIAMSIVIPLGVALLLSLLFGVNVHASESRTVDFKTGFTSNYNESSVADYRYDVSVTGSGNFNARCYFYEQSVGNTNTTYQAIIYLVSNESFSYNITSLDSGNTQFFSSTEDDGTYYSVLFSGGFFCRNGETPVPYGTHYYTFSGNILSDWNNGLIDLSSDSYDFSPSYTYNADIPTPQVVLNQYGKLGFNNKTDDYYFELQGRWRTAQDIDIYTENLVWKYKFQSRIDSDLTTWVSQDDRRLATEDELYLSQLGADNFAALLSAYPSAERNIYTSNALGEVLSGFAHEKALFINYLDIAGNFLINSPEIYVRYYTVDDSGNVEYGKWCHAYVTMPTSGKMRTFADDITDGFAYVSTQSDKGLTEDELTYVEDLEDTRLETDATISNNSDGSVYVPNAEMDSTELVNNLQNMFNQAKSYFDLFGAVFSFLPEWLRNLIYSALATMVVIGVYKFIRG